MKKTRLVRSVCLGLTLVAGASLVGCGSGSDSVSSPGATSFSLKANAVTIAVVDAASGNVVNGATLALSASVPLYDANGVVVTSVTATNGVATVYTASRGTIQAVATHSGYLSGSSELTQSGKQTLGTVSLINASTSSESAGITAAAAASVTPTAGVVKAGSFAVSTPLASVAATTEAVTVKDASGVVVSTPVALSVAGVNVAKAVSALPGTQSVGTDVAAKPIQFAGAAILGASSGASARVAARAAGGVSGSFTFAPGVQLTLRIPANWNNPVTTKYYAKGDSVGVYYLADGQVTWSDLHQKVVVQEDASGLYAVVIANRTGAWGVGQLMSDNSGSLVLSLPNLSGYDVSITFSTPGWTKTVHTAGDTLINVSGLPVAKGLTILASLPGSTLLALDNKAYSSGARVVINVSAPGTMVSIPVSLKCKEAGVSLPTIGSGAGFSAVFMSRGSLVAQTTLTDSANVIHGLTQGNTYNYALSLSIGDITGSFTATGSALTISVPCSLLSYEVVTTGASGNP